MEKNLLAQCFKAFVSLKRTFAVSILSIGLNLSTFGVEAQSVLLKDINTTQDIYHNEFTSLVPASNVVYLVVNNELWKTTGNDGGTVKLKAFQQIGNLTTIGSTVFFSADDGTGMELWKSTGTSGSTVKVKDFAPDTAGGNPEFLTNVNGTLYFVAYTATYGRELWKSDGTEVGTILVKDILRVKGGSNPAFLTNVNGILYFAANDGKAGYEIWKSDGTADGTVMAVDVRPGAGLSSTPEFLTNVNGTLFFVASDGNSGRELWKTDGTTAGSFRLKDIRPGSGSPLIKNMTAVDNTIFFTANDGIHGFELWKSDGSEEGTVLVKDMTPGPAGSHGEQVFTHQMGNFKSVFGSLYFTAYENDTYYIWKSDGTEGGTVPVQTAFHGINTPSPNFVAKGNYIYYFNSIPDDYSDNQFHLYRMNPDGTHPVIITALYQDGFYSSYNPALINFKNTLYFNALGGPESGFQLFRSDGTPGSKMLIKDPYRPTLGSNPYSITKTGDNKVFFAAEESLYDYSPGLWTTNGTPEGTIKLKEIYTSLNSMVGTSTHIYFAESYGLEIWKSDGTVEGTVLVKADPTGYRASNLVSVNDLVFFQTSDGKLWRTDGTEEGTFSLPVTGTGNMNAVGNLLYFTVRRADNMVELWRTNGLASGTNQLYTFYGGDPEPYYKPVAVTGNIMYFIANDGISGNEVWRTDGTASGTYQIADLHSTDTHRQGSVEDDIRSLEVWNNTLYISAFDDTENWALYKSDGTRGNAVKVVDLMNPVEKMIAVGDRLHFFASNTSEYYLVSHWVTDGTSEGTEIISGDAYFSPYGGWDHIILNGVLYYPANGELFRSDGTACGTYPVNVGVLATGRLENIGNILVFSGHTGFLGSEPYAFNLTKAPQSPCGTPMFTASKGSMESLRVTEEEGINTPYPNPFSQDFSFRVNGNEKDVIDIDVYTSTGFPVERLTDLKANTGYVLGANWPAGLYILNVKSAGKMTAQKVIKK